MGIRLAGHELRNRALLAPMAGITDAPFRAAAWRLGAGLVISEMVASREVLRATGRSMRHETHRRRLRGTRDAGWPAVVQIAGHEPEVMAAAARLALREGARVIDINMGCPARLVTGKLSGAALMRDPSLARAIIAAIVPVAAAHGASVSLKMRLGWDDSMRNAPEMASMAAGEGVAMVTVHGRTRQQFYDGKADWRGVGDVVAALRARGHDIPVIVNGDITDAASARRALARSGADGVMIGRAAVGRPWLPGEIARALDPGRGVAPLAPARQVGEVIRLHAAMIAFHGRLPGMRRARKHLKAALACWRRQGWLSPRREETLRRELLRCEDAARVEEILRNLAARAPLEPEVACHD